MNGVGGGVGARATCRGKSVVDRILVDEDMRLDCGKMVVEEMDGEGGRRDGDHSFLWMDWEMGGERRGGMVVEDESSPQKGSCNLKRGWRDEWKKLREAGDRIMKEWCGRYENNETYVLKDMMREWREVYDKVVEAGVGWRRGGVGKGRKKNWYDDEVCRLKKELKVIMKEMLREIEIG